MKTTTENTAERKNLSPVLIYLVKREVTDRAIEKDVNMTKVLAMIFKDSGIDWKFYSDANSLDVWAEDNSKDVLELMDRLLEDHSADMRFSREVELNRLAISFIDSISYYFDENK